MASAPAIISVNSCVIEPCLARLYFSDKSLIISSALLVAESIAQQLENRVSFRRAMKSAMNRTMKTGALGVKASCAGRLGGADIARTETYSDGTIPLQTLRADIDYGFAEADTTYGKVGVKVWIYKGEILPKKKNEQAVAASDESKGGDN